MRGGARARSGPAPDPDALRRERDGDSWTTLPVEGRRGDPPEWPLTEKSKREDALWRREWKRPQAIVWERNGQEVEVAMYVRTLVAAEKPDAAHNMRNLVRQQQETLGISLTGLARNQWRIGTLVKPESAGGKGAKVVSINDRLPKVSA